MLPRENFTYLDTQELTSEHSYANCFSTSSHEVQGGGANVSPSKYSPDIALLFCVVVYPLFVTVYN